MGKIIEITEKFPQTVVWMDSLIEADIDFGLANHSRGITTAPTVGPACLQAEYESHIPAIQRLIEEMPCASERKILWAWMYETVKERSRKMLKLFGDGRSNDGHVAIQMNIFDYRDPEKMQKQADLIAGLYPNYIIKIPATKAGLTVIERSVAKGYSVLATMISGVGQLLAAAEAQKRGLEACARSGLDTGRVATICAMQLNIPELCIRNYAYQQGIALSEEAQRLATVAVTKKAYRLLREKAYPTTLMLSNFKREEHWHEFLGGDLILTMPGWLQRQVDVFEGDLEYRIDREVPTNVTEELLEKVPFYRDIYEEDAVTPDGFEKMVTFTHTAQFFLNRYDAGIRLVRDLMLPNEYATGIDSY